MQIMQEDLIYDVGMYNGEDTYLYLIKGFWVVAIEANQNFAAECTKRFSEHVPSGKLTPGRPTHSDANINSGFCRRRA